MGESGHITVAVVDDHRTFSDLLTMALDATDDLTCIGSADNVGDAVDLVRRKHPDVVLMDVRLGTESGLSAVDTLTSEMPSLKALLLTADADYDLVSAAVESGACGVLTKNGSLPQLLDAVRNVPRGGFYLDPAVAADMVSGRHSALSPESELTRRELEVLTRLAYGMTVNKISAELCIAVSTCRGYVKSILSKLDVHTQLEAVSVGIRVGLIAPPKSANL